MHTLVELLRSDGHWKTVPVRGADSSLLPARSLSASWRSQGQASFLLIHHHWHFYLALGIQDKRMEQGNPESKDVSTLSIVTPVSVEKILVRKKLRKVSEDGKISHVQGYIVLTCQNRPKAVYRFSAILIKILIQFIINLEIFSTSYGKTNKNKTQR